VDRTVIKTTRPKTTLTISMHNENDLVPCSRGNWPHGGRGGAAGEIKKEQNRVLKAGSKKPTKGNRGEC